MRRFQKRAACHSNGVASVARPGKVSGPTKRPGSASTLITASGETPGRGAVPRISIIIAHQNDQRLEDTLLSVLENRPRDSEIIVAHDGSYCDPYDLQDEVLFVETSQGSRRVSKLNEGLYATCAPVVHILGEGMLVTQDWCEGAIHKIQRQQVAAVSPLVQTQASGGTTFAGLNAKTLASRGLLAVRGSAPTACAGPVLAAGFYSRRALLSLGGLLEAVDGRVADVDLALCLRQLGLACEVDDSSLVIGSQRLVSPHQDARMAQDLAGLLAAHGELDSGIVAGLKGASQRLLRNLFNPSRWAPSIAWGIGLANNRLTAQVSDRLNAWLRAQASQSQTTSASIGIFHHDANTMHQPARRAA